jgi:predicted NBD/HSP70 family sugar kinase
MYGDERHKLSLSICSAPAAAVVYIYRPLKRRSRLCWSWPETPAPLLTMELDNTNRRRSKGMQRVDLAYAKLASSEIARDINRDVILELVRTKQPVSRADLSRLSGLQPSTTSVIVEQLLQEQWIMESGVGTKDRGRPSVLLSLNTNVIIAVADIRPTQAILAIVDLDGGFLAREIVPIGKDPIRGTEQIIRVLKQLIAQFAEKSCEGIGISLPGRVDPATQRLTFSPNLPWSMFDLKSAIEKEIPLQVEMDNAANAALLSELWFGRMDGIRTAVLLTISEGIGAAILVNGQLVTGSRGLAGEFGHTAIVPDGLQCGCGRKGCWEMYASSRAATRYYAESQPKEPCSSIVDLLRLAEDGNKKAMSALVKQAQYLVAGLRTIITSLAPELVLLTGGITASWQTFGPMIEAQLTESMVDGGGPRVTVSADAELARLRGAAALVLQKHSGNMGTGQSSVGTRNTKKRTKAAAASR